MKLLNRMMLVGLLLGSAPLAQAKMSGENAYLALIGSACGGTANPQGCAQVFIAQLMALIYAL